MKNLIENKYLECEKELKININLSVEDVMFIKGKMEAYMNILQSLKDYNIITAPKQIKLSEIVERLNKNIIEGSTISLCRHDNEIDVWEDYKISDDEEETNGSTFIFKIDSNSIIKMIARDDRIPKWLYTLWIAGTEIVDDLGGE